MNTFLINAIEHNHVLPICELQQYLWKDEINDLFILTKHMEIYLYSGYTTETINKAVLGCYCWSKKIALLLQNKGVIFDFWSTDDELQTFKTNIKNLPFILLLGTFKRRPDITGEWIRDKEQKLGHRIIPYQYCKIEETREVFCMF